jgi:hypothetical protein
MHDSFGIQNPRLFIPFYLFAFLQGALQRRRMAREDDIAVWLSWFSTVPFQT